MPARCVLLAVKLLALYTMLCDLSAGLSEPALDCLELGIAPDDLVHVPKR